MKIVFVWRKVDKVSGGVERMSAAMMNYMQERGHEVHFLTWDHENAQTYYELHKNIEWHKIAIGNPAYKGSWATRFKRMTKVRQIIKRIKPDLILCFESGIFLSTRLFLAGYKTPMIAAERNAPSRHSYTSKPYKKYSVWASLFLADAITVQFERYKNDYPAFLQHKIHALHNPVKIEEETVAPGHEASKKILLCVGRPSYQKNIQALIKAFANLVEKYPDWILKIAGDGEEFKDLERLIAQHNLTEKVFLLGGVRDVKSLYLSSHLFCLPSRYEGFPNALAESLSYGLPAVGYEECCGARDLIADGKTGLLAAGNGQIESLTIALDTLMQNPQLREKMGAAAKESMKIYEPKKVMQEWEALLEKIKSKA